MERGEVNKEIKVVKKGFFYFLVMAIVWPIKQLFKLLSFFFRYLKSFLNEVREYNIRNKQSQALNKILSRKREDEEVI